MRFKHSPDETLAGIFLPDPLQAAQFPVIGKPGKKQADVRRRQAQSAYYVHIARHNDHEILWDQASVLVRLHRAHCPEELRRAKVIEAAWIRHEKALTKPDVQIPLEFAKQIAGVSLKPEDDSHEHTASMDWDWFPSRS